MPIMPKASSQKYKDANSNYGIKVSEATVAKLRKGTKASNIAAANKPGASAEYKEAVRRFYGKNAVAKSPVKVPGPKQTGPVAPASKTPTIDRSNPKPTPAQIAAGKKAKANANKNKMTPNNREDRRTVAKSPKPTGGPGAKSVRPQAPKGGPGAKPRPSKGQTPNQREGRRPVSSPRPSGGPGAKPRTKKYTMRPGG